MVRMSSQSNGTERTSRRLSVLLPIAMVMMTTPIMARGARPSGCLEWLTPQQCAQISGLLVVTPALNVKVAPDVNWNPQPCNSQSDLCAHSFPNTMPSTLFCASTGRNVSCSIDYCQYDSCAETNCWQDAHKSCCNEGDQETTTTWGVCH
jgi:hypothetical protein